MEDRILVKDSKFSLNSPLGSYPSFFQLSSAYYQAGCYWLSSNTTLSTGLQKLLSLLAIEERTINASKFVKGNFPANNIKDLVSNTAIKQRCQQNTAACCRSKLLHKKTLDSCWSPKEDYQLHIKVFVKMFNLVIKQTTSPEEFKLLQPVNPFIERATPVHSFRIGMSFNLSPLN